MEEKKFCKFCGEKIDKSCVVCPKCGRQLELVKEKKEENITFEEKNKKFYENDWFMWVALILFAPLGIFLMWKYNNKIKYNTKIILSIIFGIFFIFIITSGTKNTNRDDNNKKYEINNNYETTTKETVSVIDFSTMTSAEIDSWCKDNKVNCIISQEYSNSIEKGKFVSQSVESSKTVYQGDTIKIKYSLGKEPTAEYKSALRKAELYSSTMNMSKQGVYDQLVSEYGEKFPADAAQYAIDNMTADWNANALAKAKTYQQMMSMSKQSIYDQLISQYGEKFTKSQAQYAIDHLDD